MSVRPSKVVGLDAGGPGRGVRSARKKRLLGLGLVGDCFWVQYRQLLDWLTLTSCLKMNGDVASDKAWEIFGPLVDCLEGAGSLVSGESGDLVKLGRFKAERADAALEVGWVGTMLFVVDVTPEDAPSARAWGMLLVARKDPQKFWDGLHTKATQEELKRASRKRDDNAEFIEEAEDRFLAGVAEFNKVRVEVVPVPAEPLVPVEVPVDVPSEKELKSGAEVISDILGG